jgi:BMFP domain-containing protein YqiC
MTFRQVGSENVKKPKHTDEEYEILKQAAIYHKEERKKLRARIKELEKELNNPEYLDWKATCIDDEEDKQ